VLKHNLRAFKNLAYTGRHQTIRKQL